MPKEILNGIEYGNGIDHQKLLKIGDAPLDTTADNLSDAVNELKSALSDLDLNVPHFKGMFDITTDLTSDKTYTATESCIVLLKTEGLNMTLYINAYVDGIGIGQTTAQGQTVNNIYAFLKKGSVLTLNASYPYNGTFHAYVV